MNKDKMLSETGRFPCKCCSDFGHRAKAKERRAKKRRERAAWKKDVR